jgi:predicted CoA-substrate-specific enzyme activase
MRSAGFSLGASSVGMVVLERDEKGVRVLHSESRAHDGNPRRVFEQCFHRVQEDCCGIAATGRKFRDRLQLPTLPEPKAIEFAYEYLRLKYPGIEAIVSAGGETFMVYELDPKGCISNVHTGDKCASGTGDFFLQQLKRMDLSMEEAMAQGSGAVPYRIASRCSVFSKSDCTHALNKGVPKGCVVAGLCSMMAGKILALLKKTQAKRVLLVGGTARNRLLVENLRHEFPEVIVPEEASCFEALGSALWALDHPITQWPENLFKEGKSSFNLLEPLWKNVEYVAWRQGDSGTARDGDRCIVGLDVGSTTTKAILLRTSDEAVLASTYLRTNGDPVGASRRCYKALEAQIQENISIIGLGVTGSGRQIAGLHAMTDGVVNEIIAHAAGAVHFDPEVDTIIEIGGQDAKYTFLTNRVASDYAMNEACSAGTGSFLEEAARESLGLETEKIADAALLGLTPPNFNDQCAAFIASDIKSAIQEGLSHEDIAAGLVYSICLNYLNRVKGNREIGRKVFMQGGVCYNRAVPVAMAALTGRQIIVPPDPGLMGAFGVALVIKEKLELGLMEETSFDLGVLAKRGVLYRKSFECRGGQEKCDLKCQINQIEVEGQAFPFGGSCNRYTNVRRKLEVDSSKLDLVVQRERLVFRGCSTERHGNGAGKRIGLNLSLMVHTLFPLYYTFFSSLGLEVVMPKDKDISGIDRKGASFCYPVELAHAHLASLLKENLDYVFLPQVRGMYVENGAQNSVVCPLAQGEPYYLKAAFKELTGERVLSPVLDFSHGLMGSRERFVELGHELGFDRKHSLWAFRKAAATQRSLARKMAKAGQKALSELEHNPEKIGVVIFGRPYNAFTQTANLGIPHKFASRGHIVMPLDALSFTEEVPEETMYWSMGQLIMKAAKFVKRHPQLFATYITNFSCGPDSFLVNYFRGIMGDKPSLTLELDGHTADAGLDTRIEAFLDIVASYHELQRRQEKKPDKSEEFRLAAISMESTGVSVVDSQGIHHSLSSSRVKIIVPCIGERIARYIAAVWRRNGSRAVALPPPGERELKAGRGNSSCKECLPFTLVTGSVLEYLEHRSDPGEVSVIFLPQSTGPCRFGQYTVEIANRLKQKQIPNAVILSLSCEDGYAGLSQSFQIRSWRAIVLADVMDDIYSGIMALARDRDTALHVFQQVTDSFETAMEFVPWEHLPTVLRRGARELAAIPRKGSLRDAKKVVLAGEIFVRRDPLSRQYLVERLAEQGIVCKVTPIHEWMYYSEFIYRNAIYLRKPTLAANLGSLAKEFMQNQMERSIKHILSKSGFYEHHRINIGQLLESVEHLIAPEMVGGDAALTIAAAINEIIDEVHGVIVIGPFGCLPNRIAEAILTHRLNQEKIQITDDRTLARRILETHPSLPFLTIESDGGPFPQVIQAKLEAFVLQVERMHGTMRKLEESIAV